MRYKHSLHYTLWITSQHSTSIHVSNSPTQILYWSVRRSAPSSTHPLKSHYDVALAERVRENEEESSLLVLNKYLIVAGAGLSAKGNRVCVYFASLEILDT